MDKQMYHHIRTNNFSTAFEICKLFDSFDDIVFAVNVKPVDDDDVFDVEYSITFAFEVGDEE